MADVTREFFDQLGGRAHQPLLENARGSLRFDLSNGRQTDHWLVTVTKGKVATSRERGEADCVIRADRALFDRIAGGEQNAMAALLRGAVTVEGDLELLRLFQRLVPGPPSSRDRRSAVGSSRREP
jgi:predicted lipid carrier protein YhbT